MGIPNNCPSATCPFNRRKQDPPTTPPPPHCSPFSPLPCSLPPAVTSEHSRPRQPLPVRRFPSAVQSPRSKARNSCGIAVISFDFSATCTCPNVSILCRPSTHQHDCVPFPPLLPSIATTSPSFNSATSATPHWAPSRHRNSRQKVSCDGIPLGNGRNPANHSFFACCSSPSSLK